MSLAELSGAPWTDKFQQPTVVRSRRGDAAGSRGDVRRGARAADGCGDLEERGVAGGAVAVDADYAASARARGARRVCGRGRTDSRPEQSSVCVTLTTEQIQAMEVRRLKKWVRDGIAFARAVGGVCWPTYTLGAGVHVEDLLELLDRKARACAEEPQAISAGVWGLLPRGAGAIGGVGAWAGGRSIITPQRFTRQGGRDGGPTRGRFIHAVMP